MQRDTKLKKVNGGYVVQGGPLMPIFGGEGISIGQFAVTKGTDEATLRHETAHLQQYREWGAYKYMSNLGTSPFGRGEAVGENEADRRAGTFAYDVNSRKRFRSILFSVSNVNQTSSYLNSMAIVIYLDYLP
ncbi:hypothetical protein [Leptospira vanthielii]|uniref:Uncharacterized protein n=1 Tax=Leptospira vanthielii serovar Holland str. Waz Holland = ATCC 700522 TaxID=1218591 RepID=N1W5H7_9LEPT|nr:hypothetical protein [Leptospira vanthielii]EMY68725.1 hypothetical protein LEP1GSC199_1653 [Leptospira vanthielii serovar Holland str. Waz Holland = ATCC 700522]